MTKWDIDPNGVATVLTNTGQEAQALEPLVKDFGDYAERAVRQTSGTPLVAQATANLFEFRKDSWQNIFDQISASLNGTKDATLAYMNGQYDMALNAERHAANAPAQRKKAEADARAKANPHTMNRKAT